MKGMTLSRAGEGAILFLLALGILWKGGKTLEMTWLLAILAAALSIVSLLPRVFRFGKKEKASAMHAGDPHFLLWATLLLFMAWSILSYAFSETRNYGLDEILRDVSCILLFLWITRAVASGKNQSLPRTILTLVTPVTVVACLIGMAVYALEPVDRFVGSFFDYRFDTDFWPNAWGEYLLLAWPLVMLHSIHHRKEKFGWVFAPLSGLIAAGMLLSYSRGSILSFAVQVMVLGICSCVLLIRDIRYRKGFGKEIRLFLLYSGSAACVAFVLFFGANAARSLHFPVQSVTEKVTFTADEGRSSIDERAQFWKQSFDASLEKPLFGYGPYSFRFVQTEDAQGVLATSDHPHNIFLKLAMERGWVAAVLFALILLGVAFPSLRKLFYERRSDWSFEKDCQALLFGTAIIGVLTHNLIDYNFQFVGIAFFFWIVLALLYAPAAAPREKGSPSFARWKYASAAATVEMALAILLLLVTVSEGGYLVTSSLARHAEADGDTAAALDWYERSEGELFSRDLLLSKAVILMEDGEYERSGQALARYATQNRHDARVWKLEGILALKQNDPEVAFDNIRKAFELGKMTDLGITTLYLQSARSANRSADIVVEKKELDALFMAYADAIGENAHFIALSRNVEEFQTVARLLGQFFPADAARYADISRKASDHAAVERARLTSRTPGFLW